MILLRLLTLLVIFYVIFSALKAFYLGRREKDPRAGQIGESMVLDPQCQTYVPKSVAIVRDGKYFCSEECARLFLNH
ncbi:MAG TPA: PP0621 family protein [Candidatus Binatus sp.]|nr:PP0621 family protein [Candidatus Binatus sp.]